MNEEIKQINSEIKEYQDKIDELMKKKEILISSTSNVGKFVKNISPNSKEYICVNSIKGARGFWDTMLTGLIICKRFGGGYSVMSDDAMYVNKNDIIEITKEEFEEVLDKAINNFKSVIQ